MGNPGLSGAPDALLVERALDGDARAFEVIVRRHGPLMRAVATRLLGSAADGDDVVQESFVVAWHRMDALRDQGAVRPWLVRIVGRKSIDRLRSRREHADIADWDPPAAPEESTERRVESRSGIEALSRALRALPDEQRECWVLREVGGHSYQEMADLLQVPVSTVRGSLARARAALIRQLEAWR